MPHETSVCFHTQCVNCCIPSKATRTNAVAGQVVDTVLDYASTIDGFVTAAELGGIARRLSKDYQVSELQGQIAGCTVLALSGDCESRQEMNKLVKEL